MHFESISDTCEINRLKMPIKDIYYSDKYTDDTYEYRHVMLPKDIAKQVPTTHLMSEDEWRGIGVQQSQVVGAS